MRSWLFSPSLALLAACAALPDTSDPDPIVATADQIEAGHQFAAAHCASCHAIGATGKSHVRDAPAFRNLSRRYPVSSLGEAFAEGISTGHPDMPEWEFQPDQITALLGYIQSIQAGRRG
ncbi:MAG: c-type cytochrome [Alphaproteobacteria bacterium]|nr:c-type cytochrome [Alphaproteobacteria bacterium]